MTPFVISNDLIVLGSSSFAGGQTFDGQVIIDLDDAEALLVRKDGDAGDVFIVDTLGDLVKIVPTAAQLILPSSNDSNTPTLAFGDGDTGFYEQTDDQIQVAIAGLATVRFSATAMRSTTSDSWNLAHGAASLTVPAYQFQGDVNTGIGHADNDLLSLIAGGASVIQIAGTGEDFIQVRHQGAFLSNGASNLVTGAMFASDIISASGDVALSHIRAGVTGGGSLVTSGAGDSVFAATLWLDEPDITLTPSDAMAIAATLFISGEPTEGTSANYGIFNSAKLRQDGTADFFGNITQPGASANFTLGSGVPQTHARMAFIAAFVSDGISNHAEMLFVGGTVTGFAGDTVSLAGLLADASVTTQGATQVIADVAQVIIQEPNITIGSGDTVTNAQSLLIVGAPTEGVNNYALRVASGDVLLGGNLAVSGAGPHAIAGTPSGIIGLIISETFTSDGAATFASGVYITQTLVGASGDTTSLTGVTFISAITTQTETESIANISQVEINEPFITDNLTGDITNAQTLLIVNAPTEGLSNYAVRVIAGATFLGGELEHAGSTLGFFGTSPTTQPAAYTRNATIVEDRTLLASASATALNNNNVLAALIADLQSLGVIQ